MGNKILFLEIPKWEIPLSPFAAQSAAGSTKGNRLLSPVPLLTILDFLSVMFYTWRETNFYLLFTGVGGIIPIKQQNIDQAFEYIILLRVIN